MMLCSIHPLNQKKKREKIHISNKSNNNNKTTVFEISLFLFLLLVVLCFFLAIRSCEGIQQQRHDRATRISYGPVARIQPVEILR
mmetsp:Transcript_3257/g.6716  ORF Transcript_3257/g.6716 Transcript_3257/m.6716 type:complete len:85 (-) Transcript_3257:2277-2531(-)